ncbi:MAG: LLM class flavin-dependent oxidoreductase [Candidatus Rokubacteria bacterium]|nr:LLM class flavin-dependent oxidoreductase [Candidatus Rokubacteria bacterium]
MAPPSVRFGVSLGAFPGAVPGRDELVQFARKAEAVGFDSVQAGDHIQWHAPILETTTLLATFAAVTERVRIASDVIVLPLRDPVWMAKTIASLDVLSGGRVIFGIGVGGDYPPEYAAVRVPIEERGSRANESLEIIRGLWTHERFSYAGRHFTLRDVAIAPRPLQPSIPIWVGGGSEAALRRAARYGDGWIAAFASPRKFGRLSADLRRFLGEEGRRPEGFTLGAYLFANVDDDAARARETAARYVERVYRLDGARIVERFGAAGPVDACAERALAYVGAGADYVVLGPLSDHRDWPRQLDGYGEVIERVGRRAGGR